MVSSRLEERVENRESRASAPAFSVTLDDCEVQTFRSGGKGGQNQNKRDTGVRIIHHASGARGEARDERSQLQNKKAAFRRMVEDPKFRVWTKRMLFHAGESPEQRVEKDLASKNLLVEGRTDGEWHPL